MVKRDRYATAMEEYLIMAAERVLRRTEGLAALVWYSNDTTPMATPTNVLECRGGLDLHEEGKAVW